MDFFKRFPGRAFLPVIHVKNGGYNEMLENARIAFDEGADGIFLISHDYMLGDTQLLEYARKLKRVIKDEWQGNFWIGLNLLSLGDRHPAAIFRRIDGSTEGLWIDSIDCGPKTHPDGNADELLQERQRNGWDGILFGGAAFKYQPHIPTDKLVEVARRATKYADVVTTSGDATGKAPAMEKIREMKSGIGSFPLAIASGMTPGNVHLYLPYADAFLVATGISKSFTELDPALVRQMRKAIPR